LTALIEPCLAGNSAEPIVDTFNPVVTKDGQGHVIILTSGTTGKPKGVQHTWESLLRPSRSGACGDSPVWFSSYALHLYAGLQVACQSMVDSGTFVYSFGPNDFANVPNLFKKYGVQYAAGTPSFWRRVCLFFDRESIFGPEIKQITLGGEVIDQNILNKLKSLFPQVRLVHIYATTELGRCFSVTDGEAGFPLRFCDKVSADGIQLKICDGQLYVRSANAMVGYDESAPRQETVDDWFASGDLVTVEGDRVHFSGRVSDIINVGGNKVSPLEVEKSIRNVEGVLDVRVYPQKSTLVGNLVACEVVAAPELDVEQMKNSILSHCHKQFGAYHVPRFINFVDHIELSEAGKMVRRWSI
jgi:acyl-coenzyme A synthetase/AMP-(fatty) acid ligase